VRGVSAGDFGEPKMRVMMTRQDSKGSSVAVGPEYSTGSAPASVRTSSEEWNGGGALRACLREQVQRAKQFHLPLNGFAGIVAAFGAMAESAAKSATVS